MARANPDVGGIASKRAATVCWRRNSAAPEDHPEKLHALLVARHIR